MPVKLNPDNSSADYVDGLDRHYYESQVGSPSPLDDTYPFRLAAARAKDRARHNLVRAIREADRQARANRSVVQELGDIWDGNRGITAERSIDGVKGAPDDAIKV